MKTFKDFLNDLQEEKEEVHHATIKNAGADSMSSADKENHKNKFKRRYGVDVKHHGNSVTYSGSKRGVLSATVAHNELARQARHDAARKKYQQ